MRYILMSFMIGILWSGLLVAQVSVSIGATNTIAVDGDLIITVSGDWENNGSFEPGTGEVNFEGTTDQTITSNGSGSFYNMSVANSGGSLKLAGNLQVENMLAMISGIIDTQSDVLIHGVASEGTLSYTAGHIVGNYSRYIGTSVGLRLFPVGSATSARPLSIDYVTAPATSGVLTVAHSDTGGSFAFLNPILNDTGYSVDRRSQMSWQTDASGLIGGIYNLSIDGAGQVGISDPAELRVVYSDTEDSFSLEGVHSTGSGATARRDSIGGETFGQFFLGGNGLDNPFDGGTPIVVVQGTSLSDFENDTLTYYINEGPIGYDQPLTIRNVGDGVLNWSVTDEDSLGADCPNISVSPSGASIPAGGTQSIVVTLDPIGLITDNVYYCDMLIASNDPVTPVYTITVCINVISKWAEFMTEVQSVPPGNPIAPGDSIRDLFSFINNTGAEQTVRISTKWLRNTGQLQDQLSQRSPVLGRFEVNSNRNKKFAVPTTMPLDTNWVISYIEHINGDTICTDTAAFEVVSAETKAAMLGLAYGAGIPDQIALHRNYPNPFNPSTTIKYDLNEDTHVKIQVFNVLGQQVKTLVNGFEQAGYRQVVWDGTNNKGQSVASGIYIYRMEVLSSLRQGSVQRSSGTRFMEIHKMLLTK